MEIKGGGEDEVEVNVLCPVLPRSTPPRPAGEVVVDEVEVVDVKRDLPSPLFFPLPDSEEIERDLPSPLFPVPNSEATAIIISSDSETDDNYNSDSEEEEKREQQQQQQQQQQSRSYNGESDEYTDTDDADNESNNSEGEGSDDDNDTSAEIYAVERSLEQLKKQAVKILKIIERKSVHQHQHQIVTDIVADIEEKIKLLTSTSCMEKSRKIKPLREFHESVVFALGVIMRMITITASGASGTVSTVSRVPSNKRKLNDEEEVDEGLDVDMETEEKEPKRKCRMCEKTKMIIRNRKHINVLKKKLIENRNKEEETLHKILIAQKKKRIQEDADALKQKRAIKKNFEIRWNALSNIQNNLLEKIME